MSRLGRMSGVATVVASLVLTGCSADPLQGLPLPFRHGVGDGSYTIRVQMADVVNLVRNAEVKVDDVTVGSITDIRFHDWRADLTVGLDPDVVLPANATARIGQKSLLGAGYLELSAPAGQHAVGRLRTGDTIPLSRTDRYPETEEALAALSVVLNGGGLQHLRTISTELDAALSGREGDIRKLVDDLRVLVGTLDKQKRSIVRAIDGMAGLSARLAKETGKVEKALRVLPEGVASLEENRARLVDSLEALSRLGRTAKRVINASQDDLLANLRALRPAVRELADAGSNLTQSFSYLVSFPFPSHTAFPNVFKGDYGNLFIIVDLDPKVLARNFGVGFPSGPGGLPLGGLPPLGRGVDGGDPLRLPVEPPSVKPHSLPLVGGAGETSTPRSEPSQGSEGLLDGLLGGGR